MADPKTKKEQLVEDVKTRLEAIKKTNVLAKKAAAYQSSIADEQARLAGKEAKLIQKKKEQRSSAFAMSGSSNYEHAYYEFIGRLVLDDKIRRNSPRWDITIQALTTMKSLFSNYVSYPIKDFCKKHFYGDKVGIEYVIDVDNDGKPSFMLTSEGDRVNQDTNDVFRNLVEEAILLEGYKKSAKGGFVDKTGAVLTQEKFDTTIAEKLKSDLELATNVNDYHPPILRP